jgi:hypothetical protein
LAVIINVKPIAIPIINVIVRPMPKVNNVGYCIPNF